MLAYIILLIAALAGFASVHPWAVAACALALAAVSFSKHQALYRRAQDKQLTFEIENSLAGTLANALATSGIAYVGGMLFKLI